MMTRLALSTLLVPPLVARVALYSGISGRDLLSLALSAATTSGSSTLSVEYTNEELRQKVAALDLDTRLHCFRALVDEIELGNNHPSTMQKDSIALRVALASVKELIHEIITLLDSLDYSLGLDEPSSVQRAASLTAWSPIAMRSGNGLTGRNVLTPLTTKTVEKLCVYSSLLQSRFDFLVEILQIHADKHARQAQFGKEIYQNTFF